MTRMVNIDRVRQLVNLAGLDSSRVRIDNSGKVYLGDRLIAIPKSSGFAHWNLDYDEDDVKINLILLKRKL